MEGGDGLARRDLPGGLLEWSGERSGGARRLFDSDSGRPSGGVLSTNLLARLRRWASDFASDAPATPRIILLVGGPGNGKTEAVESTVAWLDESLGQQGALAAMLGRSFATSGALRLAQARIQDPSGRSTVLEVVQDASLPDAGPPERQGYQALVEDLGRALAAGSGAAYLCCVNRGVLDDALMHSIELGLGTARQLLEAITRSVSLASGSPACWPLDGYPDVAVWPMDSESLLVPTDEGDAAPAATLLARATDEGRWPAAGTCAAASKCPFCASRGLLSKDPHRASLLKVLRWYELSSGKRWNFRDLFSMVSYSLTGSRTPASSARHGPCGWAAEQLELDAKCAGTKPERLRSAAIYQLVTSSYQHLLFRQWDPAAAPRLHQDLKELGLRDDHVLMGLYFFLRHPVAPGVTGSLGPLLGDLSRVLDPALSDPDKEIELSGRTRKPARDIDSRFSQSVGAGLAFLKPYHCLSDLEVELLGRLALADAMLGEEPRRKRPAAALRVQRLLREFACRLAKRSIGMRSGAVRDAAVLADFQQLVDTQHGSDELMYAAASQVEALLNKGEYFEVPLNTTFGQPLPPEARRATLVVPKQRVREGSDNRPGRPRSPIPFLRIGPRGGQEVPLTYELFKSVSEITKGMSPSSLPKTVVALLDTTRARLSGPIVRNEDELDGAHFQVGRSPEQVVRARGRFVRRERAR